MNKYAKLLAIATIIGAVGITYAANKLKYFSDGFEWDDEEEDYEQ